MADKPDKAAFQVIVLVCCTLLVGVGDSRQIGMFGVALCLSWRELKLG